MYQLIAIALAASAAYNAHASLFGFNDFKAYEKCLNTDGIEEVTSTANGMEKKWVGGMNLKERCVERAVAIADKQSNPAVLLEAVEMTRRLAGAQLALRLAQRSVKLQVSQCNDMKIYGLVLTALQNPPVRGVETSDLEQARKLVLTCLKDKSFKADFVEELTNANQYTREGACIILKDAKVVKSCGGAR